MTLFSILLSDLEPPRLPVDSGGERSITPTNYRLGPGGEVESPATRAWK